LRRGTLIIHENEARHRFGNDDDALLGEIVVFDPGFYRAIVAGGSVGAAEAYMDGLWDSPDLVAVVRVMARNMTALDAVEGGMTHLVACFRRLVHLSRRNTRSGSKRNIAAHYDLSNDFFASWLDTSMMYSSAIFPDEAADLDEAARFKLDTICRKLDLKPGDRVVEIGTGWGGFAIHAAARYGCRVTTTTISAEQHRIAAERIAEAGLEDRITLLLSDYRDLEGKFDKLVSIEMIEAVGHDFLGSYFETCARLLEPDGQMLIQAITMPDDRYESALREVDFIKRYIFPGSFIPSIGAMVAAMGKHTDLRLVHLEDMTSHYARTLAAWHERFLLAAGTPAVAGFGERFRRMWTYYLSYCEGGFRERVIGSAQLVFAKPSHRGTTESWRLAAREH